MDALKKAALLALASAAVILLLIWSVNAFGVRSPVFALLANWLVMSWVALAGQALRFPLPARWFEIRPIERGRLYPLLGVPFFKKLVRRGPLAVFNTALRLPAESSQPALLHLDGQMRSAEAGHVYVCALMLAWSFYAAARGWLDAAGWALLFNVAINGYPILLQRYNRILLAELIRRQGA